MLKNEEYVVKYNIQKPDGYWEIGLEHSVFLCHKNQHKKAEKEFKHIFPKAEVVSVKYV